MSERQAYSSRVDVGSEPSRSAVPRAASRAPLTILATSGRGYVDASASSIGPGAPARPRKGLTGRGMRLRKLRRSRGAGVGDGFGGRGGRVRNFSSAKKSTEKGAEAWPEVDLLDFGAGTASL